MKILLFFVLFPLSLFAEERTQAFSLSELNSFLQTTPQGPQVDCFDPNETPACEKITEQFCNQLGENGGRITEPTGSISIGMSQRSELSEMERANLVDITRALPRLPQDLQREVQRPIQKLARLIQQENNSKNWYRDVSRVRNEIAEQISDVAKRRADVLIRARLPQGQRATDADKKAERDTQYRALMETFTRAKVDSSPNWARIQSVYSRVKQDMVAVINTLALTAEEKKQRIDRINQTNLSYPFGVRVGGVIGQIVESDCRTNMINAMYMPFTGTLTVCAGFLNGYQSENSVYFTLAHELAHAFNLKQIQSASSTPKWGQLTNQLIQTNSNIPCEEYTRFAAEERTRQPNFVCGTDSYNNFMTCLNGNRPAPASNNQDSYNSALTMYGRVNFCDITNREQGLAYMNPNEFADRRFAGFISSGMQEYTGPALTSARGMLSPAYYVAQEMRCNPAAVCNDVQGSARLRAALGVHSPACMTSSERGAENESDWYAHKAMTLRLRGMTDIRARRQLVAGSLGLFCPFNYSRALSDKDQARLEKEAQRIAEEAGSGGGEDHHSSNEERISAAMTDEMASLLQCTKPGPISPPGYQSCKL